jgi:hypothetical protein
MKARDPNDTLREEGPEALRKRFDGANPYPFNGNGAYVRDDDQFTGFDPADDDIYVELPKSPPKVISPKPYVCRDPAAIPAREFLFGLHIARGFVSSTVGRTKTGKTANAIAEMLAMVTGKPILGGSEREPLRGWYVGEDPYEEIERRFAAARVLYKIEAKDIGGRLFVDSVHNGAIGNFRVAVQTKGGVVVNEAEVVQPLIAAIKADRIDVLIIDPLIKFHGVQENDNSAMEQVAAVLSRIAQVTNCGIDFLQHIRKPGNGQNTRATIDDARGASATVSAARSVRILNPMNEGEAEKAGIEANERWRYLRIDRVSNITPPEEASWRQLTSTTLPCGDSIGVCTTWKFPSAFSDVTTADVFWVRKVAQGRAFRADTQAKNWIGHVIAGHFGLNMDNKADKAKVKQIVKVWIKNGVLIEEKRQDPGTRKEFVYVVPGPFKDGEGDWP